jgi:hypothetical protein
VLRLATVVAAVGGAAFIAPAAASTWAFETPAEAAYCRLEVDAFRCVTPNDGFWIRFTGIYGGDEVAVRKGYSPRFRGLRSAAVQVLGFGRRWASSGTEVVVCTSARTGLTCKHPATGLSFWLGRYRGYRIFYVKPGWPLKVRPLFRTTTIWCGINLDTLEPANPTLLCWHPTSGVVASVVHDDAGRGGSAHRSEQALGFRPRAYRLLHAGARFFWRCRSVTRLFAEGCSTEAGRAAFTCSVAARVRCTNLRGRGFALDPRGGFDMF